MLRYSSTIRFRVQGFRVVGFRLFAVWGLNFSGRGAASQRARRTQRGRTFIIGFRGPSVVIVEEGGKI